MRRLACGCPVHDGHRHEIRMHGEIQNQQGEPYSTRVQKAREILKSSAQERLGNVVELLNNSISKAEAANCQQIVDRIFLGPISASQSPSLLKRHKITHILGFEDMHRFKRIKYVVYNVEDNSKAPMNFLSSLPGCCLFIHQALAQSESNVLVCSKYGLSRSATAVAAYLVTTGLTPNNAWAKIRESRSWIQPNRSFVQQLKIFHALQGTLDESPSELHSYFRRKVFAHHFEHGSFNICDVKLHRLPKEAHWRQQGPDQREQLGCISHRNKTVCTTDEAPWDCLSCQYCGHILVFDRHISHRHFQVQVSEHSDDIHVVGDSASIDPDACRFFHIEPMEWMNGSVDPKTTIQTCTEAETHQEENHSRVYPQCYAPCDGECAKEEKLIPMRDREAAHTLANGDTQGPEASAEGIEDSEIYGEPRSLVVSVDPTSTSSHLQLPELPSSEMVKDGKVYDIASYSRGPLRCPGCLHHIGWFNWFGRCCSCKYFEKPAFQLVKSCVRKIHYTRVPCFISSDNLVPTPWKRDTNPPTSLQRKENRQITLRLQKIKGICSSLRD